MTFARAVAGLVLGFALAAWCAAGAPAHGEAEPAGAASHEAEADEASAHEQPDLNPLDPRADLAIWTAVIFLVLLAILWKFAWGPIVRGLDQREQGIAEQIAQAEQSNNQAKDLLAQYEHKLAGSREEVRGILDQARRDAEQLGREMLEKAKQEARAEQQRAVEQIDSATANALKELAEQSSTLAVELAGKILRAELKPEDHSQLIEQAVSNFGQQGPQGI